MRILDQNGTEIVNPDLSLGYLIPDRLFVRHHEAIPETPAVIENRVTRYPNGGVDIDPVVISPCVPGKDAWDEYEDIQRYIPYTREELEELEQQKQEAENSRPATWAELAAAIREGVNSL